jgi:geranylgeranyl pyrophosphate synthase
MLSHDEWKAHVRATIEAGLVDALARSPETEVRTVAEYITLGGGHRWRGLCAVAAGEIFRDDALDVVLPFACGIELVQSATLLLDDLPSMDDASLRRGKPTAHLVFPRWAVDLTPSYLVTLGYELGLGESLAPADRRAAAAVELSRAGQEMIAGQVADVMQTNGEVDLVDVARRKAGAFYAASVSIGGILCGASAEEVAMLHDAGLSLGVSYQILDDLADATASSARIGKEPGADSGMRTLVDLFGADVARARSADMQASANRELDRFGVRAERLKSLITEATAVAY